VARCRPTQLTTATLTVTMATSNMQHPGGGVSKD
jgi:hypothetical protein